MLDGSRGRFDRNARKMGFGAALLAVALSLALASPAEARRHHRWALPPGLTDPAKDAALVVDGETGKVLYQRNASAERHPASLTKLMTLYLLFDALKRGQITLNTPLAISEHAAVQKPTNLRLSPGATITVDTAIKAVVVHSANDVAVAVAEAIGGTESNFAQMMNEKARALGMRNTFYHNASGLPDPLQITTAEDLATLARHLAYDFPQYYHYFSTPSFAYRGAEYPNHDKLIGRYDGADGMKTGYTQASGFNLVSSVVRENTHVIGVVMGGRTAQRRDKEMMRLLDDVFDSIKRDRTLVAHNAVPWRVAENTIPYAPPPVQAPAAVGATAPPSDSEDEDSAESRTDDDEVSDVTPAQPVAPPPKPVVVASRRPAKPAASDNPVLGEGDISDAGTRAALQGVHDWTIQIGAFADQRLAYAQLAAYAEKSMDVLGQARHIVIPFQSIDGQLLYRARFGPFLEREARQICARLTERGQTCFAAISTR